MNVANLAKHLQWFFTDRLLEQQGASPHTVASYRETFPFQNTQLLYRSADYL